MNIKKLSRFNPLFWLGAVAVTIRPNIYIRTDFESKVSKEFYESTILHEQIHLKQQEKPFFFKYIFSPSFRLTSEVEAYSVQLVFLQKVKGLSEYDLQMEMVKISNILSGSGYLWMTTFANALQLMNKKVKELV